MPDQHLIRHDTRDQIFAVLLGAAEQIEMADVKEIGQCDRRYRDDGGGTLRFLR